MPTTLKKTNVVIIGLGIVGGSVMGTSGARSPTETIQALAWRTAEHLVKNWKSIVV